MISTLRWYVYYVRTSIIDLWDVGLTRRFRKLIIREASILFDSAAILRLFSFGLGTDGTQCAHRVETRHRRYDEIYSHRCERASS